MITGYDAGRPMRCVWCWETTTDIGQDWTTGATAPLHVTCAMQMLIVRRKLARLGPWVNLPDTVAARRYYRLQRHRRKLARARARQTLKLGAGR